MGQPLTHVVRADVKLVLVPVTVTDEASRPINDLPKERFRILEDGVEQQITSFSWEDGPVDLGLLFDSSGSMKGRISASVAALKYVFQTTRPDDEFFVIQFSDDVRQLGGFTSEPDEILRLLRISFRQAGWTSLLDAVALGIHRMRSAKNPAQGTPDSVRWQRQQQQVLRVRNPKQSHGSRCPYLCYRSFVPGARLLQRLAEVTGGNVLVAQNMKELPDVGAAP